MRTAIIALCLLMPSLALAQTPVKNPNRAVFTVGPDAAQVTGYELDIINSQGAVVQTLTFPAQTPDAAGDVTLTFNVQPVAFGTYTVVVRNISNATKSTNSTASEVWERAPGQPSKPRVQ
jgi:hypothetical protein